MQPFPLLLCLEAIGECGFAAMKSGKAAKTELQTYTYVIR